MSECENCGDKVECPNDLYCGFCERNYDEQNDRIKYSIPEIYNKDQCEILVREIFLNFNKRLTLQEAQELWMKQSMGYSLYWYYFERNNMKPGQEVYSEQFDNLREHWEWIVPSTDIKLKLSSYLSA